MSLIEHVRSGNDEMLSTLPTDVLLTIAKQLPPPDILRLCRVSTVFRNLFCLQGQDPGHLWAYLYHRDISRRREPPPSVDYRTAYRRIMQSPLFRLESLNNQLIEASRHGYEQMVNHLLDQGAGKYGEAMIAAAGGGYQDIVNQMLHLGAEEIAQTAKYEWLTSDYDRAMIAAARDGHLDIVNQMLDLGSKRYVDALSAAAEGGHRDIFDRLYQLLDLDQRVNQSYYILKAAGLAGYRDIINQFIDIIQLQPQIYQSLLRFLYDDVLRGAAKGGRQDLVDWALSNGAYITQITLSAAAEGGDWDILNQLIQQTDRQELFNIETKERMSVEENYNYIMERAAYAGNQNIVEHMLQLGANDYNKALIEASREGHIDIVNLMLSLGADDLNSALGVASRHGHRDIVNLLLSRGADNYNWAMMQAALRGHRDIVNRMLQLGANDYNAAMAAAAQMGQIDIVRQMLQLGAYNLVLVLQRIPNQGQINIQIRQLIQSYQQYYEHYSRLIDAAQKGDVTTVEQMIHILTGSNFNPALVAAASGGNRQIVDLLVSLGATDYPQALVAAAAAGHQNIVERMLQLGAKNYNQAIKAAEKNGHRQIARFIQQYLVKSIKTPTLAKPVNPTQRSSRQLRP
jgi:ankyrin repeat protein